MMKRLKRVALVDARKDNVRLGKEALVSDSHA